MQRYFIDEVINSTQVNLNDTMMHHLNRVLRLQQPTQIVVVDVNSRVFEVQVHPHQKNGQVLKEIHQVDDFKVPVTLAIALLKKDKFEWVIQKACELGVSSIVPFLSERTIVDLSAQEFEKKRARYQLIAQEACEQSHRKTLCQIQPLINFKQLHLVEAQFKGLCYENIEGESVSLKTGVHQSMMVVIGPEGGFSQNEVKWAKDQGFSLVSLGHRILRSETAAIASLAMIEAYHDS